MEGNIVRRAPLGWLVGGLLLGLLQVAAVGLHKPLGVSTQFVVTDSILLKKVAPDYVNAHPLISKDKYQKIGYGWMLDLGILVGAAVAALAVRRWRLRKTTVWWEANQGKSVAWRFACGFIGGVFILFGARLAHGCTSGQLASGWAQLSLAAVPFTVALFGAGMLAARLVYPRTPTIEK